MSYETLPAEITTTSGKKHPAEAFPPVLAAAVRSELDRIVRSRDFRASKRNRKFLRRVVEAELTGCGHEINGYLIGSEVFGRGKSFDHVKDPIVRIEATKLRRDLERYYLTSGRGDRIVISIPKGGYRPSFETRDESVVSEAAPEDAALDLSGVTVASLRLSEGPLSAVQPPLRAQLADSLTRTGEVAVFVSSEQNVDLLDSEAVRRAARSNGTAFVLSGDCWTNDGGHRIVVRLHDGETGRLVWSEEFAQDALNTVPLVTQRVVEARRRLAASGGTGEGV
jgi:adenylate cyclase